MMRLKELREKKQLNMRQAAFALDMPYTTYVSYEKGDREPNSEVLLTLATFFECSIDYLVGRSATPTKVEALPNENVLGGKKSSPVPEGTEDEWLEKLLKLDKSELMELRNYVRYLRYKRDHAADLG